MAISLETPSPSIYYNNWTAYPSGLDLKYYGFDIKNLTNEPSLQSGLVGFYQPWDSPALQYTAIQTGTTRSYISIPGSNFTNGTIEVRTSLSGVNFATGNGNTSAGIFWAGKTMAGTSTNPVTGGYSVRFAANTAWILESTNTIGAAAIIATGTYSANQMDFRIKIINSDNNINLYIDNILITGVNNSTNIKNGSFGLMANTPANATITRQIIFGELKVDRSIS